MIVKIPIEYIDEFKRDAVRAYRDLGAQPSLSIESYYPDPLIVIRNAKTREDPWDINRKCFKDFFKASPSARDQRGRFIHIDLGLKKDACGLAMGINDGYVEVDKELRARYG